MCKSTNNLLLTILKVRKRFSNVYDDDSIYISRDFLKFLPKFIILKNENQPLDLLILVLYILGAYRPGTI